MECALDVRCAPDGGWQVYQSGAATPLSVHDHAWAAESAALACAVARLVPTVVVRDAYGRTRTVKTAA